MISCTVYIHKGFPPVCTQLWYTCSCLLLNDFLHCLHSQGFSSSMHTTMIYLFLLAFKWFLALFTFIRFISSVQLINSKSASLGNWCTGTLLNRIVTAQWEGIGDAGSARYELALLPPMPDHKRFWVTVRYSTVRDPSIPFLSEFLEIVNMNHWIASTSKGFLTHFAFTLFFVDLIMPC